VREKMKMEEKKNGRKGNEHNTTHKKKMKE
jgi:hypothetical protein